MRVCSKCRQEKEDSEFRKSAHKSSGFISWCRECERTKAQAWKIANPDRTKELSRISAAKFFERNPERVRRVANDRYASLKGTDEYTNARLKKSYGITLEQFDEMLLNRGGMCDICGEEAHLFVDHCHNSGRIRGLLCRHCNLCLGQARDRVEVLKNAIKYLELTVAPALATT